MATIRLLEPTGDAVHRHLFSRRGEHFAFLLAAWTYSEGAPVFLVRDALLIPDDQVTITHGAWELSTDAIVDVINAGVRSGLALIEVHNHGGVRPRFSRTDRAGFVEFPPYVLESLPDRPYGATVWGDSTVYGEYFLPVGHTGIIDSVTVVGRTLRQLVSRDDDLDPAASTFDRQLAWFTEEGQRQLGRFRVGVTGAGGTGSQVIQNLAYLGVRDFVVIDDDLADDTSMNRLVTATAADLDTSKAVLGRRLIRSVAPSARVRVINTKIQSPGAIDALKGVDVLFGCFDNDGARLILNELALAYRIPYFDLGVGIDAQTGDVAEIGGRLCVVLPNGPCLDCMDEINPMEAAFDLMGPDERRVQVERGYVRGANVKAPAVVSLNGALAGIAVNEFGMLVSGVRGVAACTDLDVLGRGRPMSSQWVTPRRVKQKNGCVLCAQRDRADEVKIERYISTADA